MQHPTLPPVTLLQNVRPWGGAASDIAIADGLIASITPAGPPRDGAVDGRGLLALPGLINTHAHVDKSWWGLPWQPYGGAGGIQGRIVHERSRRRELGFPSVETTTAVLREFARHGTTAVRTHVDIDTDIGLEGIAAVRQAAAAYDGAVDVQIVAFPQDGVLRRPGVLEMMADAARAGADHLGGLDPASIDRDPVGQLDAIFGLAAEHDVGIDIHLHDPAELGAFQFDLIIDRTRALGREGKVRSPTDSLWRRSTRPGGAICSRR